MPSPTSDTKSSEENQDTSGCILIITVTKVEAQAILEKFSSTNEWPRQHIGKKTYYPLGVHGGVLVFMVQSEMGSVSPGASLLTVRQAIQDLRPQAVIMCGIAYGLHREKQTLGDVLVSKQIFDYEPQKVDENKGSIHRGDKTTASERLLDRFRSGDLTWRGAKRHFGLVLSGEKLINSPKVIKSLLKEESEAIGGEMEGAGLYAAARDAGVEWILVKAICDWADGTKNDDVQPLAASNAASFVLYVLELGGWGGTKKGSGVVVVPGGSEELLSIIRDPNQPLPERVQAGNDLATIGDPRFRSDAWYLPKEEFLGFVEIPGGPFVMGKEVSKDTEAFLLDGPQHVVDLPRYFIGRFPVTVAQYIAFLAAPFEGQPTKRIKGIENHPVVSVNWYEAVSYCRWLNDRLRTWPSTPDLLSELLRSGVWSITLPSEAEWEKAARGTDDARIYPWGLFFSKNNANCAENFLHTTSPVGCFEMGLSPYKIYDMAGNVEEWTRSNWGPNMTHPQYRYPYIAADGREDTLAPNNIHRVHKGGSFYNNFEGLKISIRNPTLPDQDYDYIGFRLAIVQIIN
jgi:formylglycine-generating enzyme required for sulfatase activity